MSRGCEVVAIARLPDMLPTSAGVKPLAWDITDPRSLRRAIAGADSLAAAFSCRADARQGDAISCRERTNAAEAPLSGAARSLRAHIGPETRTRPD
ncbi:hypothetical protein [Variovorax sp. J31P179]|uniref:hypothetical protein n=1 Tax=Variovorax sp. J31P179 TaxID=3053508 RepID=UPI0033655C80